jgi:tape measure domain-containing protein
MARMSLDTAIRLSAEVKGANNITKVQRSLQDLAKGSQTTARDMQTLRAATFQYSRANDGTIAGVRNSITAFRGLQEQAKIGSREFQRYGSEIQRLERKLKGIDGTAEKAGRSMGQNLAAGLAAGLAAAGIGQAVRGSLKAVVADEESQRRLRSLSQGLDDYSKVQSTATAAAQKFGVAQTQANQEFAQIYARLRPIGLTLEEISSVYNGFNTAAKLSGTTSAEASAAFLQLSQALGTGVLRGEELNSVFEQTPAVVQGIAQVMGVPIGQIRELAKEGKISGDIVLEALRRIERDGAPKLAEAMKGPAQQFKNLQIAGQDLQIQIGQALLPTTLALANAALALAQGFNSLPGPVKNTAIAVGIATTAILGLAVAIAALKAGLAVIGITGVVTALKGLTVAAVAAKVQMLALNATVLLNPWVALAAGIGAATYALATYRSESEKIGGKAATGDAAALAAAQRRITAKQQEISALEGQRPGARTSRGGDLARARVELAQLQRDVQTGRRAAGGGVVPAAPVTGNAMNTRIGDTVGGGGGGGGGGAKKQSESMGAQIAKSLQKALDLTPAQSAGVVGNLMRESGLNPRVNEGGAVGSPRGVGGYGLAQWTGTRQKDLVRFAGGSAAAGDLQTQLRFMVSELMGPESRALASLRKTTTPEEAAVVFDRDYERSGIKALPERKANARRVYGEIAGSGPGAGLGDFADQLKLQADASEKLREQKQAADELLNTERDRFAILQEADPMQKKIIESMNQGLEIEKKFQDLINASPEQKKTLELAQQYAIKSNTLELERELSGLAADAVKPLRDALTEAGNRLAYEREYGELLSKGINPELAKQFVELDRIATAAKTNLELQIAMLKAKLAELPIGDANIKNLERQIELRKEQLKLIPGTVAETKEIMTTTGTKAKNTPARTSPQE